MKKFRACMLCGSKKIWSVFLSRDRMLGLPGSFSVCRCQNCSLTFLNPQPDFHELSAYYPPDAYYSYQSKKKSDFFGNMRAYLISKSHQPSFFQSFLPKVPAIPRYKKNGKILDVGCGSGDTLLLLKSIGWDTYGLDIDRQAIAVAKKRGLKNVKVGTYKDIKSYPDAYFDSIRLYHVIEHLGDPQLCIKLIVKKLKPDGELVIGTPNVDSLLSKVFESQWYNLDSPRHIILFSPRTLSQLVKKNKLTISSIEYSAAGGLVGSLQYLLSDLFHRKVDLIDKQWLVMLFYPFDLISNLFRFGDIFVLRATVKK